MNLRERLLIGLTVAFIFLLILAWDIDAAHWITSGGAYPGVFGIRGALARVSPVLAVLPCTSLTLLLVALVGAVVSLVLACRWVKRRAWLMLVARSGERKK